MASIQQSSYKGREPKEDGVGDDLSGQLTKAKVSTAINVLANGGAKLGYRLHSRQPSYSTNPGTPSILQLTIFRSPQRVKNAGNRLLTAILRLYPGLEKLRAKASGLKTLYL